MKNTLTKTVTVLLTAAILPTSIMADLSKHDKENITASCKKAIGEKGYKEGYTYKYTEVMEVQSGGVSMTGQLHKGSKHFGFNCLLDKKLKISDLVIDPI